MSEEFEETGTREVDAREVGGPTEERPDAPSAHAEGDVAFEEEVAQIRAEADREGEQLRLELEEAERRLEAEYAALGKRVFEASLDDSALAGALGTATVAVAAQADRREKLVRRLDSLEGKLQARIADAERAWNAQRDARRLERELAEKEAEARAAMERAQALAAEVQKVRQAREAALGQVDAAAFSASETSLLSFVPGGDGDPDGAGRADAPAGAAVYAAVSPSRLDDGALDAAAQAADGNVDAVGPAEDAAAGSQADADESPSEDGAPLVGGDALSVAEDAAGATGEADDAESGRYDGPIADDGAGEGADGEGGAGYGGASAGPAESGSDGQAPVPADAGGPGPSDPGMTMLLDDDAPDLPSCPPAVAADPNATMLLDDDAPGGGEEDAQAGEAPHVPLCEAPGNEDGRPAPGVPAEEAARAGRAAPAGQSAPAGQAAPAGQSAPAGQAAPAVGRPLSHCPACGAPVGPNDRFCMMCGKLLREEQQGRSGFEALLCPNCGAEYHPGDKFCMMCSQPLEGAADGAGR